jgi:hypothetical protein
VVSPTAGVSTHPTPLTFAQRITRYTRANPRRLTPRQTRRLTHKANHAISRGRDA